MGKTNPSFDERIRMRVVLSVPGMDEVIRRRDLVYKTADGAPLHMDVYAPSGPAQGRPAVILIHGGPIPRIGAKNMGVFVSYGELIAASGLTAVTFNHRFLAPDRIQDAAADVGDLVEQARAQGDQLGVDPERVALWAFSGGGPFLATPLRERRPWLRALVAYYAVMDLQQRPPEDDSALSIEERRLFSAIDGLGDDARHAPPMLVARAGLDHPWLNGGIDRFVQSAFQAGGTLDVLNHPGGRHGFDILDDDDRSRRIIRRTIEFLKDHLS